MKKRYQALVVIVVVIFLGFGLRFVYYSVIDKAEGIRLKAEGSRFGAQVFEQQSVSGIYPHLTVFNENHAKEKPGETGIGAVVAWGDKLYAITYSAHRPEGSSDKLYVIDKKGKMEIHPLSVGGTPANRMIHKESRQLIIGPYFIKENGEVRVIPIEDMPGRLTATARHLTDPANKVYFYTMEEGVYEVDVYSLEVAEIYKDGNMMVPRDVAGPLLPGYHGKGAYSSQNRLVVANNGEYHWRSTPESGSLSEWDGQNWKVIERKQFTEVTGPGGLYGNEHSDDPIWSIGWDKKSLILKLRENGEWFTYRLPKASFTYDGAHGWHTEWPRIRNIGQQDWLMTMHGMFWAFPPDFSSKHNSGIRPYSSYLKIIPDFTPWQGMLVFGCDDASMFDNALVGQPQSNFWFINPDQLDDFGPKNAYGHLWMNESVKAFEESDPFLTGGFDRLMLAAFGDAGIAFNLQIERQKPGEPNWEIWKTESFNPGESVYRIFELEEDTEWIRISSDNGLENLSVHLHMTEMSYNPSDPEVFQSLPNIGSEQIKGGWLRPDGNSGDLTIFGTGMDQYYTLNEKLEFGYQPYDEEAIAVKGKLFPQRGLVGTDSVSVYYTDEDGLKWRLPWGTGGYDNWYARYPQRVIREVATERSLMNAGGIFYELPRDISGGIKKIKPITTHNRMIIDFCSWRGMMVISGTRTTAEPDGHYVNDPDLGTGLWLGTIDDLWSFGRASGTGGPWNNSRVKAGELSDPYLMLGFDEKTLFLSHDSQETVTFELLADFVGEGEFRLIQVIQVNSGEGATVEFEEGFSANWVRIRADRKCRATAWFTYY
ncbi:MAG: hypothetical protein U9N86_19245 [Bacteroidota bacterium]|nr:hypothetical protein [Bacteroidota bacterium]